MTPAVGTNSCNSCSRFWSYFNICLGRTCDVATRSVKAGDKPQLHRVRGHFENNRNGRGRRFGREGCGRRGCGDYFHLTTNQISHHCGQSINLALCPAVFDRHVAAFDVTSFAQSLEKGRYLSPPVTLWGRAANESDHR
jgi:hypothetical protein